MLAPAAVCDLRRDPALRRAIHRHIAVAFALVSRFDHFGLWLARNHDRLRLAGATAMLSTREAGVTTRELLGAAKAMRLGSRGAVLAFLERARAAGYFAPADPLLPPGDQPIVPGRAGWRMARRSVRLIYSALAIDYPEVGPIARADYATLRALGRAMLMVLLARASAPPRAPATFESFFHRDRAVLFAFCLIEQQPRDGEHLIARAALSRRGLARRLGVSRVHLNRLIAEGIAEGVMTMPSEDSLFFSPEISCEIEASFAEAIQLFRALAFAVRRDPPFLHPAFGRIERLSPMG